MAILFPALGVASAAICVWLGMRIVNRRERWAKRMAVALAALLLEYPLSIGPAHCLVWNANTAWLRKTADVVYSPLACACDQSETATRAIFWYDNLWLDYRVPRTFTGVDLPPGFKLELMEM